MFGRLVMLESSFYICIADILGHGVRQCEHRKLVAISVEYK